MNVYGWLITIMLVLIVIGGLVLLYAYAAGNPWYTTRPGRAIVGLAADIVSVLGYATLRRLFHWPSIPTIQVIIYASVLAVVWYLAFTFLRERAVYRRGQRARTGVEGRHRESA